MELKLGHLYSRQQISEMIGGSIQAYLPVKGGKVVCGCFNTSEWYNPGAPEEVLFGRAESMPKVEESAEMVYQQGTPIPIFLFRRTAKWEYVGDYRCISLSRDPALLAQKMQAHPQRGVITGVLRFEKA
jgi:hypothetical protein